MSSRFVRGWDVSLSELRKKRSTLRAEGVLASKVNARAKRDVFMTLGEGYEAADIAEGKVLAIAALTSLFGKRLDRDMEYEYARVLELVLNDVGVPFAKTEATEIYLGHTYHVPNDDPGCWNPFLRALGLPRLAAVWASDNLAFPWAEPLGTGWPVWTVLAPKALPAIAAELAPLTRAHLDALPTEQLTDSPEYADETRDELWDGLVKLRKWIARTTPGNSLVLAMDGDQ